MIWISYHRNGYRNPDDVKVTVEDISDKKEELITKGEEDNQDDMFYDKTTLSF